MIEEKSKNKSRIHIGMILLITSITMSVIGISIYFKLSKPEFYKYFIDVGNKFLNESKYEEAILEFEKAIHIEPKSIEARIGNGKGYIGTNKVDNAVEEFKEAQNIDIENTKLLLQILEILKDIDSGIAYDILQNYIDKTQNTIPDNIQEIINNSNDKPKTPIINPYSGTYINPISIKLKQDRLIVGHTFYYTLDGSEPNKESIKYNGGIEIKEDTIIKLIAYNPQNEPSEVITLEYFIDTEILNKLNELIKECEELNKNTEEGTNIGNCIKGSKKKFVAIIESVKSSLGKDAISYEIANEMYERLSNALDEFKYNIIEKTNKNVLNVLKDTITKAQSIHDKSVEGKNDGQFKVGSKGKLLSVIKEAQYIYDDILSKQSDIDNSISSLNQAINIFNSSKVSTFTIEKALEYAKNRFGDVGESRVDELGTEITVLEYIIEGSVMEEDNNGRYYMFDRKDKFYREHIDPSMLVYVQPLGGNYYISYAALQVYENGDIYVTN